MILTDINITECIIIDSIRELSSNSDAGPEGIPPSLLLNCAHELAPSLLILFKQSLLSGVIAPSLERAAIVPVFKSGDRTVPSNDRHISLTYVIIKVLERIVRNQIVAFLISKGYLNPTQHEFRGGCSCLLAWLNVFDDIRHLMSGGNSVDMVYLDVAKAFDKVDHGVLLLKIKTLGITGILGVWLYHFLTDRTHFVRLQGGASLDSPVLSGVTQGTVLGPLLFIILMSDINCGISSTSIVSFVDDMRFMNIARLMTKSKQKLKFLADLCNSTTLFLCLCDVIQDSEIQIPYFLIARSYRYSRVGGRVYVYVRNTVHFKICLCFTNSVCELLILKLQNPSIIIIIIYKLPLCLDCDFIDVISRAEQYILTIPAPLPNIILLGDFNFPLINWSNPNFQCPLSSPLFHISDRLFYVVRMWVQLKR